jgi:hypothetical protein
LQLFGRRQREAGVVRAAPGRAWWFSSVRAATSAWALGWNTRTGDAFELSVPGGAVEQVKVANTLDAEDTLFTPMTDAGDLTGLRASFTPVVGQTGMRPRRQPAELTTVIKLRWHTVRFRNGVW